MSGSPNAWIGSIVVEVRLRVGHVAAGPARKASLLMEERAGMVGEGRTLFCLCRRGCLKAGSDLEAFDCPGCFVGDG
jgi:hypothetical protein